jgi:hypothetical protein
MKYPVMNELSSMKRKMIRFDPEKSPDVARGHYPNGSKINFLCSGRDGVDRAVYIEPEAVLPENAMGYSTVIKYLRSVSFG